METLHAGPPAAPEDLDGEPLAALGTSRINYFAAAKGLHSSAEAVRSGSADFRRLICAFHLLAPALNMAQKEKPAITAP